MIFYSAEKEIRNVYCSLDSDLSTVFLHCLLSSIVYNLTRLQFQLVLTSRRRTEQEKKMSILNNSGFISRL